MRGFIVAAIEAIHLAAVESKLIGHWFSLERESPQLGQTDSRP